MIGNTEKIWGDPRLRYLYSYGPIEIERGTVAGMIAKVREKVAPFRFRLAAREIAKTLQLTSGDKVLELGSGLGLLGQAINKEAKGEIKYFGVDLAFESAEASENHGLLESQASAINLPYADNAFDALVTTDVLGHVQDSRQAVSEIVRVLKPGGRAFIVIADPSEARFGRIGDHINRTDSSSNVNYWEELLEKEGLMVLQEDSERYRRRDWRKIFNLPFLVKLKEKPGFACAFNPINRPGTYVVVKSLGKN